MNNEVAFYGRYSISRTHTKYRGDVHSEPQLNTTTTTTNKPTQRQQPTLRRTFTFWFCLLFGINMKLARES